MSPRPKSSPDPRVKQFIDYAFKLYLERYKTKMLIGVVETTNVKRLLQSCDDLERLKKLWDFYFNYKGQDWQLKGSTKDIRCFITLYNRIVQLYGNRRQDPGHSDNSIKGSQVINEVLTAKFASEFNLQIQAKRYIENLPANVREEKIKAVETELLQKFPKTTAWPPAVLRQTAESHLHDRCADWLRKKEEQNNEM